MPPTSVCSPRRYPTAAARLKNSRLRPGTKVFGRPAALSWMALSRVSAVSLMRPSTDRSIMWSAPSRSRHCAKRKPIAPTPRPHPLAPLRKARADRRQHGLARLQFDMVALAVVKAYGLHVGKLRQRPGQAGGGVLAAGEKNECVSGSHGVRGASSPWREHKARTEMQEGIHDQHQALRVGGWRGRDQGRHQPPRRRLVQAIVTAMKASRNIMMPPTTGSPSGTTGTMLSTGSSDGAAGAGKWWGSDI